MKIFIGTDEATTEIGKLVSSLEKQGHELILGGHLVDENLKWHWAEIGLEGGNLIGTKNVDIAILLCWSGTGVCMAANKVQGVRAALCWDVETAQLARKWDNANVLCLALRNLELNKAEEIVNTFVTTAFDEEKLDQVRFLI